MKMGGKAMLRLFKKKANQEYVSGASAYVKENYESPDRAAKTCLKSNLENSLSDPGVRFSLKNTYDAQSIDKIMMEQASSLNHIQTGKTLDRYVNATFVDHLCEYIRQKNLKDPQVYKAAHLDRRLFSKIMSDSKYQPAKDTAIALAVALHLTQNEVNTFLSSAGHTLSHSIRRDIIIEYFFRRNIYDLSDINAVLEVMGEKEIGR